MKLRSLQIACLFLLLRCIGWAAADETFRFVHIADTQFGMYESDRSFEAETANFEKVAAEINRLKPAFVVIGGDLVNKAGDPAQIAEFRRILATIDRAIPVHLVEGNHDVGNSPTAESIAAYKKMFGPNYYTFTYRDFVGIVIDSNLITAAADPVAAEADAQFAWLKDELAKTAVTGARYRFVFQHHPFFLSSPNEPVSGFLNIAPDRRSKYYDLLKSAGVTYILAGHTHRFNAARDGPVRMIAVGAVGRPPNGTPSGMAIVTVSPSGVDYRYYRLDQIPIMDSTPPDASVPP